MIKAGEIDAQENPLTNTVTYGVHKFHRFHTHQQSFLHFAADLPAPADVRRLARRPASGDAESRDRGGRVPARAARAGGGRTRARRSRPQGCEIVELTAEQHEAFAKAVQPILTRRARCTATELFKLI